MISNHFKQCVHFSLKRNLYQHSFQKLLDIHPSVKNALQCNEPVVALESTIITHGMPYPQNFETAIEVENIVKSNGATPATIACIDGRIKVGLSQDSIAHLAKMDRSNVIKSSRRDLAYVVANAKCSGTTVAATMIVAHMAGIKIFATGGVGGVHRDGHITMDVSADLVELGRTPVTVVSSGVKSILDIPRTLEYLETQGVCVAAYNSEEGKFPDFYTRDSGCIAPYNIQTPQEAANLIKSLNQLQLQSGILIAVPIPHEYAVEKQLIDASISQAYKVAIKKGVNGKEVTPFLLAAIADLSKGSSLAANIALIKNNAKIASQIACELSKTTSKTDFHRSYDIKSTLRKPLIIGASILDFCVTIQDDIPITLDGATYHTNVKESAGGVGRNLAEALHKLYGAANFISVVGRDHMGQSLIQLLPQCLRSDVLVDEEKTTSVCSILFDKLGNCKICLANMDIHKSLTPQLVEEHEEYFKHTPLVVIDGNLSVNTIKKILELSQKYNKPVFFEPTDMLIAGKPFELDRSLTQSIRIITPNIFELKTIAESITKKHISWDPNSILLSQDLLLDKCKTLVKLIENKFDCIVVTLGEHGVLVNLRGESFDQIMFDQTAQYINISTNKFSTRFYASTSVENIMNVSGAGDSFSSGLVTGLLRGFSLNDSISFGFVAAKLSLQSNSAVPTQYFKNTIEEQNFLINENNSLEFKDL